MSYLSSPSSFFVLEVYSSLESEILQISIWFTPFVICITLEIQLLQIPFLKCWKMLIYVLNTKSSNLIFFIRMFPL